MNAAQLATSGELARELTAPPPEDPRRPSKMAPGLYRDLPAEVYHRRELGVVSCSAITHLVPDSVPAHYLAWVGGEERVETPALSFGRALHMRCLEPELFYRTYVVEPSFGPTRKTGDVSSEQAKENKTRREAWRVEHAGAVVLESASGIATLGMIESIAEHELARPLLERGESELTAIWRDDETGLVCKARADKYREDLGALVDVKSTVRACADAFKRSIESYGYHRQHPHYRDGFRAVGMPADKFIFVAVEKTPPFAVDVHTIDASWLRDGERQVRRAMRLMAECVERASFPGYPGGIKTLSRPRWAKDSDE